jgi:zinc protease
LAQATEGELKSPDYLTQRSLLKALYPPNDPLQREATPQTISALALDDVKSYYGSTFRPDETTIVIIGDITPAQAKASVAKWFGAWTSSGPPPPTDLPPVPPNAPSAATVPATGRTQDTVRLAETLTIRRSNPDYYALQVGNTILGGGFYATRFYRDVRKIAGLAYYVGAQLRVGRTRSSYTVEYGCDPPKTSRARRLIERDLRDMQTSVASASEMQLARALLIRAIPVAEASEETIAGGLLTRSLQDLPLDEPIRAAQRYLVITPQQVRAAFAKWIRPNAFVQIVEGPNPL